MGKYTIKKAGLKDLDKLVRHRVGVFEKIGKIADKQEFEELVQKNYDYFSSRMDKNEAGYFFIEDEAHALLAVGAFCLLHKPPINSSKTGVEGYIFNMVTEEEYRGQGMAGAILNRIISHLASLGVYKISLEANELSSPLYKRNGFSGDPLYLVKNK